MRDAIFPSINHRAIVHPRAEDRADRAPKLLRRILRKRFASALFDQRLESFHQLLQIRHRQFYVWEIVFAVTLVLQMFDRAFEWFMVFARPFLHAHDHVAVHLQKAAIRIPGEPRVARFLRNDLNHLVVHSQIQDRVHHTGHRIARPRPDRDQKRLFFVAKLLVD